MRVEVGIVVPVYNEEETLEAKINELSKNLQRENQPSDIIYDIIISDNNSTDRTSEIALELSCNNPIVLYHHLPEKGKGLAVNDAWLAYDYDIYMFMDLDLATNLRHIDEAVKKIQNGADLVIGSRYAPGANAHRTKQRLYVSKISLTAFKLLFGNIASDVQCGFKAINKSLKDDILKYMKLKTYLYDMELILRAHYAGYKIEELPVEWSENPNSKVNLFPDLPKAGLDLMWLWYQKMAGRLNQD